MNNLVPSTSSLVDNICKIEICKSWKNCIDIRISNDTSINNITDHFLLLKSYLFSDKYIVIGVSIVVESKKNESNDKIMFIVDNLNVNYMYRLNYNEFISWYLSSYSNMDVYLDEFECYDVFYRMRMNKLDKDDMLVPLYPWSESWIKYNSVSYYNRN